MNGAPVVAVNGRFVTQDVTGSQRYAEELVSRLAGRGGVRVMLIIPPGEILELAPDERTPLRRDERWSGMRGHVWEQTTLRTLFRASGASVLFSPCGWGPVSVREQVVVVHDIHALIHPQYYEPSYARWCRVMTPLLLRRSRRIVASSDTARTQLVEHVGIDPGRIDIVPPAVGPPFTDRDLDDLDRRSREYCLFVGGDKIQKNLSFLTAFWPQVHRELGLELWVTERAVGCRAMVDVEEVSGVVRISDPSDDELADAYASALCLLWPSIAEGYGIPLLEAMAVGTPFVSTDVGAARELAVRPDQVLPLAPELWIDQVREWRARPPTELWREGAERARGATWERSADALAAALQPLLRGGAHPLRRG